MRTESMFSIAWKIVHVFAVLVILVGTTRSFCLSEPLDIELILEVDSTLDSGTTEIELENGETVSVYEA